MHCGQTPAKLPGVENITVLRRDGEARFYGLQTCGSVWLCSVCSVRINEVRQQELLDLLDWAESEGHTVLLFTMAIRHKRTSDLKRLLSGMNNSKRKLCLSQVWQNLEPSIIGSVTTTEVMHGKNGWHPYYREILILKGNVPNARKMVDEALGKVWMNCLGEDSRGRGAGFDVRDGIQVSQYVSNFGDRAEDSGWGLPEDMAMSNSKSDKSSARSPMKLLRNATRGNERAGRLWYIFARAFEDKRQLIWSSGLKNLAGISEVEDEAIAKEENCKPDQDEVIANIPIPTWYIVRHLNSEILTAAEVGGIKAVEHILENPTPPTCECCGAEMVLVQ